MRFILLFLITMLWGCGLASVAVPDIPLDPAAAAKIASQAEGLHRQEALINALRGGNDKQATTIAEQDQKIRDAEKVVLAANLNLANEKHQKVEMQQGHTRSVLMWFSAMCALVAVAAGLAAWLVPFGTRWTISVAVGAAGIGVIAIAVSSIVAYLPYIGGALAIAGVGVALLMSHRGSRVTQVLADQWQTYAAHVPDEIRQKLDDASHVAQRAGGDWVGSAVTHLLQRHKANPPPPTA